MISREIQTIYKFEQNFKMSSMKAVLILIICAKMCCSLKWSKQMEAFCEYKYFDFVNMSSDSYLHFHRKCNHWTVNYAKSTQSYEMFSFEESIQSLRIAILTITHIEICSRLSNRLPEANSGLSAKYCLPWNMHTYRSVR